MATSIVKGLHGALIADGQLTGYLATYQGGPAVFMRRPVPPDAVEPYVVIGSPVSDVGVATLAGVDAARDQERDIWLFAPATGAVGPIDAAGERIASVLGGLQPTIDGYRTVSVRVIDGPREMSADDDSYGRLISVRIHLVR